MNKDIESFLNQYLSLPAYIIDIFEGLLEYIEYDANYFLVQTNEHNPCFYILKSGIVRSYLLTENGKEATRALFTTGDITGPTSAVIRGIPSELNYQTLTPVTAYKGSLTKLKELTLKYHELSVFYCKALEKAYLKAEQLILEIATLNAAERYLLLKQKIPNIENLITQKQIASYLNITNVQLSRIRKSLK